MQLSTHELEWAGYPDSRLTPLHPLYHPVTFLIYLTISLIKTHSVAPHCFHNDVLIHGCPTSFPTRSSLPYSTCAQLLVPDLPALVQPRLFPFWPTYQGPAHLQCPTPADSRVYRWQCSLPLRHVRLYLSSSCTWEGLSVFADTWAEYFAHSKARVFGCPGM